MYKYIYILYINIYISNLCALDMSHPMRSTLV